jgi:Lon protease-like protein
LTSVGVRLLPLFPLPLVLFPRAPLPLHIFEPRYRELVADCLNGTREFGVICRPETVAESDILPGTAGCIARIDTAEHLPDGRANVLVTGTDRFQLERFVVDSAPYHVGEVTTLADQPEPPHLLAPLADTLRGLFHRVGRSARAIADDASPLPDLPEDAAEMSFAAAQYIDLELDVKQRLLASTSPAHRLRVLNDLLENVIETVEQRAHVHARARSNGHGPQPEAG